MAASMPPRDYELPKPPSEPILVWRLAVKPATSLSQAFALKHCHDDGRQV
jgi:hypothetical protein